MLSAVSGFIKIRYLLDKAVIDNMVFRCHYRITTAILFTCCIIVTANNLIGKCIFVNFSNSNLKPVKISAVYANVLAMPLATYICAYNYKRLR